jgi:formate hydrogenlyase subunit 4
MSNSTILQTIIFVCILFLMPPLLLGIIRKTKARMQNRIGAPLFQPYFNLLKLFNKYETISKNTTWIFRSTAACNFALLILLAFLMPWTSCRPIQINSDLFLILYLLGLTRFFTVLAALDAGSAFGGFGASREVTLAMLVEPAVMLCLASLGSVAQTSNLTEVFAYSRNSMLENQPGLWILAGMGLFLASLVELSRMPADDPTTHLELTMVHEAMILENSGANLALTEYSHCLRILILLGLSCQSMLHACSFMWHTTGLIRGTASILAIMLLAAFIAVLESLTVKLRWIKLPEFIAYSVAMSIFCVLIALGKNL